MYHQHLITAAQQATAITPQQARYAGFILAALIVMAAWRSIFGSSRSGD